MIEFKGLPRKQQRNKEELAWNMGKPGAWEIYERMTNEKAEEVKQIVDDPENNIDMVINKIDKIETKIKFKAFGKTKPKFKRKVKETVQEKSQSEKDDDLKEREIEKVEKHINDIKANNHGRAGNVYRIRKAIAGHKKAGQEASSIKDPKTGELHVVKETIKKVTLAYCVKNLQGNTPDDNVKEDVKQRKLKQIKEMKDEDEDTLEFDLDDFKDIVKKFGKNQLKHMIFSLSLE